jgi:hypothetical protein
VRGRPSAQQGCVRCWTQTLTRVLRAGHGLRQGLPRSRALCSPVARAHSAWLGRLDRLDEGPSAVPCTSQRGLRPCKRRRHVPNIRDDVQTRRVADTCAQQNVGVRHRSRTSDQMRRTLCLASDRTYRDHRGQPAAARLGFSEVVRVFQQRNTGRDSCFWHRSNQYHPFVRDRAMLDRGGTEMRSISGYILHSRVPWLDATRLASSVAYKRVMSHARDQGLPAAAAPGTARVRNRNAVILDPKVTYTRCVCT